MDITERLKEIIREETSIDVNQDTRKREVVEVRALYCNLVKHLQPKSTMQYIGDSVNRNHSSILHLLKTYPTIESYNPAMKRLKLKILSYFEPSEVIAEDTANDLLIKKIRDLNFKVSELEEQLSKPVFNNSTINKLNELMLKYDGTENKNIIVDRLEAFYKMNSNLTRFI